MVQPGFGLDTPRTNLGDATYLGQQPDLEMTDEPSFQSPSKEPNVFQALRNGNGKPSLRTPRGTKNRPPFGDRINLPKGISGGEFTPLLKSATRNSARRRSGKENGLVTPAALGKIDEDSTPIPLGDTSVYRSSRDPSFLERTSLPDVDSDSTASTPMIMRRGKASNGGPLQDGQQLSLREQENVIDKIEKENFGLKLKIHFLEEALRKAGPGFSEAALKENTELKVDKVTMQRELQRYKKHLTSAEKDLETYRQQLAEMQELARKKQGSHENTGELNRLRHDLEEKDADIEDLQQQLQSDRQALDRVERLQDEIGDLEADLREKERAISERDDELDSLKAKVRRADDQSHDELDKLRDEIDDLQADIREKDRLIGEREDNLEDLHSRVQQAEDKAKNAQIRMIELEEKAQASGKLQEARETMQDLEANVRDLERQVEDMKDKLEEAVAEKERAEADLEELHEDMANKSVVTKGLPRQMEEKVLRLQDEIDSARHDYDSLEQQFTGKQREIDDLRLKLKESRQERDSAEDQRRSLATRLEEVQADLNSRADEKNLLQSRQDSLTAESASLQRDITRLQKTVSDLHGELERERQHAVDVEREIRIQHRAEIDRLNAEISDLQAEVREKENLYDNDSEKWETERHNLESERDRAEERVLGLQKTIEKLRAAEGSLNNKESKLQEALQSETERHHNEEAVLSRQIDDLQEDLSSRQQILEDIRSELSAVRDELRQSQLDKQAEAEKVVSLEDEVEVLQAALDEESERSARELEALAKECDDLRRELRELRRASDSARATTDASRQNADSNARALERLERQVDEYRVNLTKATQDKRASERECDDLRQQLNELRRLTDSAKESTDASREAADFNAKTIERLQTQVTEYKSKLTISQTEKRELQDQLSKVKIELHSVSTRLAETEAERDEIDAELQRSNRQDNDTFQIDQERISLRGHKARLENEIRRLKEENKSLVEQRNSLEQTLEDELDKAEAEEDRLNQEIISLQSEARKLHESHDMSKARRTIRDLERKLEDYQLQLAQPSTPANNLDGNSELSLVRRDLSAARQKELDFMQKESDQKAVVRGLRRQIGDLERRIHEADISRLAQSPISENASARKAEVSELRHQLSVAHQSIYDLKKSLRESERRAASMEHEVRERLDEVEDEKLALEQALEDAQQAAEEANADLTDAVDKYKLKAERYKKERDSMAVRLADARHRHVSDTISSVASTADSDMTREERHDLYEILRKTQIDADALDREVREHKEALTELAELERSLRIKLERARSERAQYRSDVEKLQRDMKALQMAKPDIDKLQRNIKSLKKAKKDAEAIAKAAMAQASVARARFTVSTFPPVPVKDSKGKQKEAQHARAQPTYSSYQPPRAVEVEDDADEEDDEDVIDAGADADDAATSTLDEDNAARVIYFKDDNDTQVHTETIVRAAEAAEHRHIKQMRAMCTQMEWMQARWERELRMRDDAAFAKQFLISEMNIKDQINEHDLLKLEAHMKQLRIKHQASQSHIPIISTSRPNLTSTAKPGLTLKRFAMVVRAVVRLRTMAREWKRQEELRKTLATKWDEFQRRDQETQQRVEQTTVEQRTQRVHRVERVERVEHVGGKSTAEQRSRHNSNNNLLKKQYVRFPHEEAAAAMGVDLDSFASSAAPLRFDEEQAEREDLGPEDFGLNGGEEMEGTEAFSVDSL